MRSADALKTVDFTFIDGSQGRDKKRQEQVDLVQGVIAEQDVRIRRLDLVDRVANGETDFISRPSVTFSFEQFSMQMLPKPSAADSLVDL